MTGKRRGSVLVGWTWVVRSPTNRRKDHQEEEGGEERCRAWRDVIYIFPQFPLGQLKDSCAASKNHHGRCSAQSPSLFDKVTRGKVKIWAECSSVQPGDQEDLGMCEQE